MATASRRKDIVPQSFLKEKEVAHMRKRITDTMFSVWDFLHRPAGVAEKDGKSFSWDEADVLVGVPIETTHLKHVYKYVVAPDRVEIVAKKLDDVCWGTLIQLTFSGKEVVDVEVIYDWLKVVYDGEV